MTTSQWLALATKGFKAKTVSTASFSSLNIFQLPAMTGFLMQLIIASTHLNDIGRSNGERVYVTLNTYVSTENSVD